MWGSASACGPCGVMSSQCSAWSSAAGACTALPAATSASGTWPAWSCCTSSRPARSVSAYWPWLPLLMALSTLPARSAAFPCFVYEQAFLLILACLSPVVLIEFRTALRIQCAQCAIRMKLCVYYKLIASVYLMPSLTTIVCASQLYSILPESAHLCDTRCCHSIMALLLGPVKPLGISVCSRASHACNC